MNIGLFPLSGIRVCDAELLRRIRRLDPVGVARDAVSVARLVRDAVGSDVTIRALTT